MKCPNCKKDKPPNGFWRNHYYCKQCASFKFSQWRLANKEKRNQYARQRYKEKPWAKTLGNISSRMANISLYKNKSYKRNNIKNLLTLNQLKYLWFRDKAYLLKQPSIHRINPQNDYTQENCRYVECKTHSALDIWAKDYDKCVVCKETKRKHRGHGLCRGCYQRWRLNLISVKSVGLN